MLALNRQAPAYKARLSFDLHLSQATCIPLTLKSQQPRPTPPGPFPDPLPPSPNPPPTKMSERKVLTKYYPPDFDPSAIKRVRGVKTDTPKLATVRLMAPFSMKCINCGEYIYKGRKFNARKEITNESYYAIKIIQFYIKCTRCSSQLVFKTSPKTMDCKLSL